MDSEGAGKPMEFSVVFLLFFGGRGDSFVLAFAYWAYPPVKRGIAEVAHRLFGQGLDTVNN